VNELRITRDSDQDGIMMGRALGSLSKEGDAERRGEKVNSRYSVRSTGWNDATKSLEVSDIEDTEAQEALIVMHLRSALNSVGNRNVLVCELHPSGGRYREAIVLNYKAGFRCFM